MLIFNNIFNNIISEEEKAEIREMFEQLKNPYSFYSRLQFLYNNSHHYTTVGPDKNICTIQQLTHIAYIAEHTSFQIFIEGTKHSNSHSTGVLVDQYNNQLLVEDIYIRITFGNNRRGFMHILMEPPIIRLYRPTEIYYNYPLECERLYEDIQPTIIQLWLEPPVGGGRAYRPRSRRRHGGTVKKRGRRKNILSKYRKYRK